MALTEIPSELSSTPSIVDGGNATAITIDSSENVGIGLTSPDATIEANITTSGSGANNNTAGSSIGVGSSGSTQPIIGMRWTGASHVGISGSAYSTQIVNDTANSNAFEMYTTGASPLVFGTAATEAFRITAARDMYFGQTTGSAASVGHVMQADGALYNTRDGGTVQFLRRLNSDGAIVDFKRDGTTIGSIGTGSGLLTVGKGTGNLVFDNALVAPCSDSSVGSSNGVVDLGASSRRFKDIYLSGGVNFSANANAAGMTSETLDDYEEGTWTPVIKSIGTGGMNATFTATNALYTKVGRMVNVTAYLFSINVDTITGGSYIVLDGLPFNASAYGDFVIAYKTGAAGTAGNIIGGYIQTGSAYAYLMRSSGSEAHQTETDLLLSKAMINITYPAS